MWALNTTCTLVFIDTAHLFPILYLFFPSICASQHQYFTSVIFYSFIEVNRYVNNCTYLMWIIWRVWTCAHTHVTTTNIHVNIYVTRQIQHEIYPSVECLSPSTTLPTTGTTRDSRPLVLLIFPNLDLLSMEQTLPVSPSPLSWPPPFHVLFLGCYCSPPHCCRNSWFQKDRRYNVSVRMDRGWGPGMPLVGTYWYSHYGKQYGASSES